ncbi:GLPGLI family protein [Winogradskyella sp.]|uniref:GLPGLI family protein n=1 Tax=Winogradskyella sp. TaxID=1883156 RepID=UPI00260C8596|nr:GLPGLI family protein [Winogradskyella sp.]
MRILFAVFLCFTMTFCFAQKKEVEITYKKTILIDFDRETKPTNNFSKNEALKLLKKLNLEFKNKTFKLWFNDTISCFKELKRMDLENKTDIISILNNVGGLTEGVFFTHKNSKQLIQQKSFDAKKYLIYSNTDSLQWNMTNESKQIDGYTAYKATTIRQRVTRSGLNNETITAWYTPEIPTSFGPAGFNNLPGLILQLQIGKLSLYASKIEFNKEIDIFSLEPKKGKKISKEDFIKLELEQIEN